MLIAGLLPLKFSTKVDLFGYFFLEKKLIGHVFLVVEMRTFLGNADERGNLFNEKIF